MVLRKRQRRRLLLLLLLVVLAAGGAFGVRAWRDSQREDEARVAGAAGRRALAAGDYQAALNGLGRYLGEFRDDGATAEDFRLYAEALRHVPMPNDKHLSGAISALRTALQRDPDDERARGLLLGLYQRVGHTAEALDLIGVMRSRHPDDASLLQAECEVLVLRRQFDEALEVAEEYNARAPDDLMGFLRTLELQLRVGRAAFQVVEWVDGVVAEAADDPGRELLRAAAFQRLTVEDRTDVELAERADQSLERVLARAGELRDPMGVRVLVELLDRRSRFDDGLETLRAHADIRDSGLRVELARRLWYAQRADELPGLLAAWTGEGDTAVPPEALALAALAAERDGPNEWLAALRARTDEGAEAWARVVERLLGAEAVDPVAAAAEVEAVLVTAPGSGFALQLIGDLREDAGEPDLAFEAWSTAAKASPSWARPLRKMAEALIGTERQHLAPELARAALLRSPTDPECHATYVRVFEANVSSFDADQQKALLESLESLSKETEGGLPPELAMLELGVLSRTDREETERRLRQLLASDEKASERTLLRLAELARDIDSDLQESFLELSESLHGITPRLAFVRAAEGARDGGAGAALQVFDGLRERSGAADADLSWMSVRAGLLDVLGDARAGDAWLTLAAAHPELIAPQLGALSSLSAWKRRDSIRVVIDRVRELTSDGGVTWRLADARWVLEDARATDADIAEVRASLTAVLEVAPSSVQAHVLLARALERLGSVEGAHKELEAAAALSPDNAGIQLELVRLAMLAGRAVAARTQLADLLAAGELRPDEIARAARLLVAQGDYTRSVEVLSDTVSRRTAPREGVLLLARLWGWMGDTDRAIALCERLLATPSLDVLETLADLYAAAGRPVDAEVVLDRLGSVPAAAGQAELVRARHAARWEGSEAGLRRYRAAVEAAPLIAEPWLELLGHAISNGDAATVSSVLDDDRAGLLDCWEFLRAHRDVCVPALGDERLRGLLRELIVATTGRETLVEAMRVVEQADESLEDRERTSTRVQRLAEAAPQFLSLQLLSADLLGRAAHLNSAITLAERTSQRFPGSATPCQQLARLLAAAGRWDAAVDAGLAWRERAGSRSPVADAFVAGAMVRAGRAADAVALIETHMAAARTYDAERHAPVIAMLAAASVASGDVDHARSLLSERLRASDAVVGELLLVSPYLFDAVDHAKDWLALLDELQLGSTRDRRIGLARAWGAFYEHFRDRRLLVAARKRATDVAENEGTAPALFVAAVLAEQAGDDAAAEAAYRGALALDDGFLAARNNLAMLLARTERGPEAVREARRVVEQLPDSGEALDTLAAAQRAAGSLDAAVAGFVRAIELDPLNLGIRLNLAEAQADGGDPAAAAATLDAIDALLARGLQVSPEERERAERLRSRIR